MRIEKCVDIGEIDVEVYVDHSDILSAIIETGNATSAILRTINNFASYMKSAPSDQIEKMNGSQKKVIHEFLTEQAERFKT